MSQVWDLNPPLLSWLSGILNRDTVCTEDGRWCDAGVMAAIRAACSSKTHLYLLVLLVLNPRTNQFHSRRDCCCLPDIVTGGFDRTPLMMEAPYMGSLVTYAVIVAHQQIFFKRHINICCR